MADHDTGRGRRSRAWWIATLVGTALAVSGVVAVGSALNGQHPPSPTAPDTEGGPAASDDRRRQPRPEPSTPVDPGMDYSRPIRLSIPSIDVTTSLEDLGLDDQGVMETPVDPSLAGWFTPSPAPGVPGASVITGHVTWDQEPAVFFRLGDLRPGDTIQVARADGSTAVFEVRRLATYPKDAFPTNAVYHQVDHPGLRLITCDGFYDEQTNNYQSNLIIWADLIGSR